MLGGTAINSGAMAVFFAIQVLGISHCDEVIIPTYVCRVDTDPLNF